MTESTVRGGKAVHSDAYIHDLDSSKANHTSEVDLGYQHDPTGEDYGPVAQRGQDVELEHPVEDVEELYHEAHLTVQFGEANRSGENDENEPSDGLSEESAAEFDKTVLQFAERALCEEGVSLDELPEKPRRVRALLLHDAWAMESYPRLVAHFEELEATAQKLGFSSIPDQSTFWRTHNALREDGYRESIQNAATRVVHAVARRGIIVPESAVTAHGLDVSVPIDEGEVAGETRRAAIRHWVDSLLDELLEPISFDRSKNLQHAVKAIIAAVAQGAYAHGLNSARPTASWHYETSEIPTAGQVSRLLRSVDTQEILRMFTDINRRFIQIASAHGFFDRDYNYALDTTWVKYEGKHVGEDGELKLIENPKQGDKGIGWLFAVLCVMDIDARFALGLNLVEDKSETTEQFRFLLRTAAREGGVNRVHIDREFYDGDAVRMCRAIAGRNWVIRAKRQGEAAELLAETPEGKSNSRRNINFADVTPGPNLYVYPVPEKFRDDAGHTHMAFLSDLDPDDTPAAEIFDTYSKRWSVETLLRQLKHDVGVETSSPYPKMRLFLLQIATLCYNIHTLMNRATSPKYALRLDVPYYEVLLAIVDVVYTRRGATELNR
ncbi:transposase [Natronobacterium gregoryi]|nr:transposase [Natronobacterium gregoryi]